jgi:hypothetical protein
MRQSTSPISGSPTSFSEAFQQLLSGQVLAQLWSQHGPKPRGQQPKLSGPQLVCGLVFHVLSGVGRLATHMQQLTGIRISDSALSQRRTAAGWQVFDRIVRAALRPMACVADQPLAFYRGLRLVGMDGSQFSVSNTPQLLGRLTKAATRRFRAAFAKVPVSLLVELGTHHPLAVAVGAQQESEWELSHRLLARLQSGWLVLADRLYGVGAFVNELLIATQSVGSHFLVRVRGNLKVKVVEVLRDGSALVRVALRDSRNRKLGTIVVREIQGRVRRPNGKWVSVRLWTSLLDASAHPAAELLALYARRWEIELFNRELKIDLRNTELLQSHTLESAAQEILALVLAMAVLSQQRVLAAALGGVDPLRMSFGQTLALVRSLWWMLAAAEGLLAPTQIEALVERTMALIAAQALPKRRARSCPRAVRRPIGSWPRLHVNSYQNGPTEYELVPTPTV